MASERIDPRAMSAPEDATPEWGERGTAAATFAAKLSFNRVSLSFAGLAAVRDVSFDLAAGEIVCLLGPSGCGKTTLLRIAAGIERPQAGEVLIDGQVIASPRAMLPPEQRNIGLVFQDYALFPHLSILDNVAFGLRHLSRQAALDEARRAIRRVGLAAFENQFPHALSGGEQQRVALARAVAARPAVLLMDEPFSGLDQRLRDRVREETLALLKETRASAMLVTHDPLEAMELADRILLMRRGEIVQQGEPEQLYHSPLDPETARFFRDFNELVAPVEKSMAHTPLGDFALKEAADASHGLVMIPPEAFQSTTRGGKDALAGKVVSARFLGSAYMLKLVFADIDKPLTARVRLARHPAPGEVMWFTINRDDVLTFAM